MKGTLCCTPSLLLFARPGKNYLGFCSAPYSTFQKKGSKKPVQSRRGFSDFHSIANTPFTSLATGKGIRAEACMRAGHRPGPSQMGQNAMTNAQQAWMRPREGDVQGAWPCRIDPTLHRSTPQPLLAVCGAARCQSPTGWARSFADPPTTPWQKNSPHTHLKGRCSSRRTPCGASSHQPHASVPLQRQTAGKASWQQWGAGSKAGTCTAAEGATLLLGQWQ